MFMPDSYLYEYETNLLLQASLLEAERADSELTEALAPSAGLVTALGSWLIVACKRGLAGLAAAFAYMPTGDEEIDAYWVYQRSIF